MLNAPDDVGVISSSQLSSSLHLSASSSKWAGVRKNSDVRWLGVEVLAVSNASEAETWASRHPNLLPHRAHQHVSKHTRLGLEPTDSHVSAKRLL